MNNKALEFATKAHGNQKRKYTGEPYINHCIAVADLVDSILAAHFQVVYDAALLHDVLEDTNTTYEDIKTEFGEFTANLVQELTNVSKLSDGNRAQRKATDKERLSKVSPLAKTIKLADLIDNSRTITQYDPNFAKIYMQEKRKLLSVLIEGDKSLWLIANKIVIDYYIDQYEQEIQELNNKYNILSAAFLLDSGVIVEVLR